MQTANIILALGGDRGQTVQKFGVSPAEVAVLREIHGEGSVYDVEPLDEDVERSSREERLRLLEIYGKPPGSREISAVEVLFPGVAARVYENFDELELDESFYKATDRAKPAKSKKKTPVKPEKIESGDGDAFDPGDDTLDEEPVEDAPMEKPSQSRSTKKSGKSTLFKD